ncbi:hypothetical protein QCA50_004458 [Cerrena zonata]|uniref:Uncharacterized protein n=1 Tax=Cerrena zonata TaxID=2478898 RepID=A0AAW0GRH8_9APHY
MDPFSTSVSGSRHPVRIPVKPKSSTPTPKTKSFRSTPQPSTRDIRPASSVRRKPTTTFKSPSLHDPNPETNATSHQSIHSISKPPSTSSSYSQSVSSDSTNRPASSSRRQPIALPLYHPKGLLALSLSQLDPAIFGLPSSVSVDDQDAEADESARRPSSRTRRPAAKLRDREREEADDNGLNGIDGVNGQTKQSSPRKRRAGAGGAAGGKRRKKDAEDADGTYPQPARRTRNARNNANAVPTSPLAGVAVAVSVAANDSAENADTPSGNADGEDTGSVQADAEVIKPNKRVTRSRPTSTKRRGSTASDSTTTSVSGSIAANGTRHKRAAEKALVEEPTKDVEMELDEKTAKSEQDDGQNESKISEETPAVEQDQITSNFNAAEEDPTAMEVDESAKASEPEVKGITPLTPEPVPAIATKEAPKEDKVSVIEPRDDKEEGELSESADGDSEKKS